MKSTYLWMVSRKAIPDIEFVKISNTEKTIQDVAIMAVAQLNCYKACLRCNVRVEATEAGNCRCSRPDCRMLQKLEFCSEHVNVQLMVLADNKFHTLSAYGKVLYELLEITPDTEVTDDMFLCLPKLNEVTYNDKNVIISFKK